MNFASPSNEIPLTAVIFSVILALVTFILILFPCQYNGEVSRRALSVTGEISGFKGHGLHACSTDGTRITKMRATGTDRFSAWHLERLAGLEVRERLHGPPWLPWRQAFGALTSRLIKVTWPLALMAAPLLNNSVGLKGTASEEV